MSLPMNDESRTRICDALREEDGNISATARRLKMRRSFLKEKIDSDVEATATLFDIREEIIDQAEQNIFSDVKNGDQKAAMFILKTLGRNRGYVSGTELSSDPARPVHLDNSITFVGVTPEFKKGMEGV